MCRISWCRRFFISMFSRATIGTKTRNRTCTQLRFKMNRREFLATASGVAAAGLFPRVSLAHLGAHEGRFGTGGLTLISGYCAEGHHLVGQAVVELISQHVSTRSEEHTSELQSLTNLVCRL